MEDICFRTPHILEQINELLDNKSLIKCKEVSRMMCSIIERQKSGKFVTTRVIQSYIKDPMEFAKDWKIVFQKLSLERLKELAILVKEFYKGVPSRLLGNWSPMHIVAERGHLDFCKVIAKLRAIKSYEWPPLNFSAQAGHLEVSKFLYKEFTDKQDRRIFKIVHHLAAKNGHLEIYKFLHENSKEINPSMQEGITPLHLTAQYGHFDLCKYICDSNAFVAPPRSDMNTPLTLAVHRGHIKIARLLHERNGNQQPGEHVLLYQVLCMFLCFITVLFLVTSSPFLTDKYLFGLVFCYGFLHIEIIDILKDIMFSLWTSPKLYY
jgi:hypothetical protein